MSKNFHDLFIDQLKDMASAEMQLVEALPKMAEAAQSAELKKTINTHLKETKEQVARLKRIFKLLQEPFEVETCEAMKGLIKEGDKAIKAYRDSPVIDAAIIASAKRVEHYEMGAYGTICIYAKELDQVEVLEIIKETLAEEINANKLLTGLAEGGHFVEEVEKTAAK